MNDHPSPATSAVPPPGTSPPESTLRETIRAALADLSDLAAGLPGDTQENARLASRLAAELAEIAAMLAALPGRPPPPYSPCDHLALAALRAAFNEGRDVGAVLSTALARLAADLGSSAAVVSNRPLSWEAQHVLAILAATVGADDENLAPYAGTAALPPLGAPKILWHLLVLDPDRAAPTWITTEVTDSPGTGMSPADDLDGAGQPADFDDVVEWVQSHVHLDAEVTPIAGALAWRVTGPPRRAQQ